MCLRISESRQPRQKADRKAAARNRKCSRQPLPGRMLRSQKNFREKPPQSRCSRPPPGSAFDRPHRRARVPPPAQTGPEALRRRWQGIAELFAGNFRSRILFSCVLPSSAKGYVCPDRKKEPAEVNWKRPRRFLNIFNRAKRDFSEVSAYLLNFFRISACWPQVIFPPDICRRRSTSGRRD